MSNAKINALYEDVDEINKEFEIAYHELNVAKSITISPIKIEDSI